MSFFDRGNTTYVDATLGWKFPTWDSLKALFSKYMPQWPAGARSYQTEVLGDAQGAVMFFTNTPQEFGHEIRGIAVVDIRNGKFVRWVDYWDGRHFGVSATESLHTPPAQFPADFGESRVGESAAPAMTRYSPIAWQAISEASCTISRVRASRLPCDSTWSKAKLSKTSISSGSVFASVETWPGNSSS